MEILGLLEKNSKERNRKRLGAGNVTVLVETHRITVIQGYCSRL